MDVSRFIDIDKCSLYFNFKKYKALAIYDTLSEDTLDYILKNMHSVKEEAIEITLDENDKNLITKVKQYEFKPFYYWFIYNVSEKDKNIKISSNINYIKNRRKVKKHLTDQVHELAYRMPEHFDKYGEEKGWHKSGNKCIAYKQEKEIISILTYSFETKTNNIHIYLTYTIPEYRSQGFGKILFDFVKKLAYDNNYKTITICTDVSKDNRASNMFLKNGFKYFKTGFEKILKEKKHLLKISLVN